MSFIFILILVIILIIFSYKFLIKKAKLDNFKKAGKEWEEIVEELSRRK